MLQEPQKLLTELGLTESEVSVYLAMLSGLYSAKDIMKTTRLKRPTLYYALSSLEKRGLINKNGKEYGKMFSVESPEVLSTLAQQKAADSLLLKRNVDDLIPSLLRHQPTTIEKPSVAFYEGVDAVKTAIMATLYCKSKTIESIVPKDNFFWQVGQEFVERFVTNRMKRGIKAKNLWEIPSTKKVLNSYYQGSEVKIFPKQMNGKFETTIFIYDDKTLYISSKKNAYCVLITSHEHASMMRALFGTIWSLGTPHER
jgi:sugar-specific transcriptional regulator TrmB